MQCYNFHIYCGFWLIWPEDTGEHYRWRLYYYDGDYRKCRVYDFPEDAAESVYFQRTGVKRWDLLPADSIPDLAGHLDCWGQYNSREEDPPLSDEEEEV